MTQLTKMNKNQITQIASDILTTNKDLFFYNNFPQVDHIKIDKLAKGTLEILIKTNETAFANKVEQIRNEVHSALVNHGMTPGIDDDVLSQLKLFYTSEINLENEQKNTLEQLSKDLSKISTELKDVILAKVKL